MDYRFVFEILILFVQVLKKVLNLILETADTQKSLTEFEYVN